MSKNKSKAIVSKINKIDKIYSDLGIATYLMGKSSYHQCFAAGHVLAYVVPALKSNQYKIYYKNLRPVAYVSWALLSEKIERKYESGSYTLTMDDVQSGDRIWITEFVVPEDDAKESLRSEVIQDLKRNVFKDQKVKVVVRSEDGSVKRIFEGYGVKT